MGATNHTTNYSLSQFDPTDKPAWLQDYNGDMTKIDAGINTAQLAADAAQLTANTADGKADTANGAITNTITPAISALQTASTNQGGAINTINSLIGNGTPTTTDQTIIGAINEINAEVIHSPDWDNVIRALDQPGISYTMTSDGWIIGAIQSVSGGNAPMIQVNGALVAYAYANPNTTVVACGIYIPVKAGDVITTSGASGSTFNVNIYGVN